MIEIDRQIIFESHGYRFKNFICLLDAEKEMILQWRNHEKVRSMMVNKDIISLENHLAFIDGLKSRDDCYYWLVMDSEGNNIGVLDVIHIEKEADVGEIGFYLNPTFLGRGFDFIIECNYFVYNQLQLGNNIVTVNVNNRDVLLLNKYLGVQYEGIETIGSEQFYVSRHSNGEFILKHYNNISLLDYARFVKKHKYDSNFL